MVFGLSPRLFLLSFCQSWILRAVWRVLWLVHCTYLERAKGLWDSSERMSANTRTWKHHLLSRESNFRQRHLRCTCNVHMTNQTKLPALQQYLTFHFTISKVSNVSNRRFTAYLLLQRQTVSTWAKMIMLTSFTLFGQASPLRVPRTNALLEEMEVARLRHSCRW